MRKIPVELENPIDNIFISLSEYFSDFFYSNNITPNILTSISNIVCIIGVLLLLNKYYALAAFLYLVAYYFDCADGYVARKYNMVTKFGDYYDHISDITKDILILGTLYWINPDKFITGIPILGLFGIFAMSHLGCQEIYYN